MTSSRSIPDRFQKGILPAVDVGRSVSRVGGKAQLPAYRAVAADLRLFYSQFEELEVFSRFGSRLDEHTRKTLARGRAVREALKQPQFQPLPAPAQIAILAAVTAGLFDDVPSDDVAHASALLAGGIASELPEVCAAIEKGEDLSAADRAAIENLARRVMPWTQPSP